MKKTHFDTIRSLKTSNVKSKLDLSRIKSTDINILLNKVRLDQKKDFKKKIIYFSLIISAFLATSFITFIKF